MTNASPEAAELYLDLLKKVLTRYVIGERYRPIEPDKDRWQRVVYEPMRRVLGSRGFEVVRQAKWDPAGREEGRDWPADAETMVGLKRLENIQSCVTDVIRSGVPGDLIETGVWRGGSTIFMRAILKAYAEPDRRVWVADSFQGLPKSDNESSAEGDRGHRLWAASKLAIPLEEVRGNFQKYGLLDDRVHFLKGWFSDTLPTAPIEQLAVMRLDGDLYDSTMDALKALYPRLSPHGYVIVDDYGALDVCKAAVEDFRAEHGIDDPIRWVDWSCVYWQRSS
jgi:O-methyltransferase